MELFQGNKWRVYPEMGEGKKALRKRKKKPNPVFF